MGASVLSERFAEYLKLDRGLSPRTVEAYSSDLAPFLARWEGRLQKLRRPDIEAYLAALSAKGAGRRTLARKLSALRLFFALASAEGWCASDPTEDVRAAVPPRSIPRTLSMEDVDLLLAAPAKAGAVTDALMLRVLYAAGLRVSELIGLEHGNVDLQAGTLRVRGKGEKTRLVPIDPETAAQLAAYLKGERPARAARRSGRARSLFLSRRGQAFTRQGFWKLIKKYALAAGLNRSVSPHVLRHAFASHLLERGMNLRSLQLLLGHADIATTEIYTHLSKGHLAETLRRHHPKSSKS